MAIQNKKKILLVLKTTKEHREMSADDKRRNT